MDPRPGFRLAVRQRVRFRGPRPGPGKPPPPQKEKPKINQIAVDAKGQTFLNDQPVTIAGLKADLQQMKADNPDLSVVVKGSDDVDYQSMVSVLDVLRQLDITKVGLATEAP